MATQMSSRLNSLALVYFGSALTGTLSWLKVRQAGCWVEIHLSGNATYQALASNDWFGRIVYRFLVFSRNFCVGVLFLFLQLSGSAQIFHVHVCDLPAECERGFVVVINGDGRAKVCADIKAIVCGEQQRCADRDLAFGDFLAIDFQDHVERTC